MKRCAVSLRQLSLLLSPGDSARPVVVEIVNICWDRRDWQQKLRYREQIAVLETGAIQKLGRGFIRLQK